MRKKNLVLILIVVTISSQYIFIGAARPVYQDNWLMYGHDIANTGYSTLSAPTTNTTFLNKQLASSSLTSSSGSAIVDNGRLYTGFQDGSFFCIDAYNGTILWGKNAHELGSIKSTPAIAENKLYIGEGNNLTCLNAENGNVLWSFPTLSIIRSSPKIMNNYIYFGSYDGVLYCVNTTGDEKWNFLTDEKIFTSPAIADGKLYCAASTDLIYGESFLYCLDATTGDELWRYHSDTSRATSCTLTSTMVYVDIGFTLYAFDRDPLNDGIDEGIHDPEGAIYDTIWKFTLANVVYSDSAAAYNNIYFSTYASANNQVYCLDAATGQQLWNYSTGSNGVYALSVADQKIYAVAPISYAGPSYLYCIDALGENGVTTQLWSWLTTTKCVVQPTIADGCVWIVCDKTWVYGFKDNQPPATPTQPQGTNPGEINQEYTYTTTATDPNNDDIWYQWMFCSTTTNWLGPYASNEPVATTYTWANPGSYEIKVKAKDIYNVESSWSNPTLIAISSPAPQLYIICQSKIEGNKELQISITAAGETIKTAKVTFNGETQTTSINGVYTFSTPVVSENTPYTITATLTGYTSAEKTITILSKTSSPIQEPHGWFYGIISDPNGKYIANAQVEATSSSDITRYTQTDSDGMYVLSLLPGTYTITVKKDGYQTEIKTNLAVVVNTAFEVNFNLNPLSVPNNEGTPGDDTQALVTSIVQSAITNGYIGAQITLTSPAEKTTPQIEYYLDDYTVHPQSTNDILSFTVSADSNTPGTFFLVFIEKEITTNPEKLTITYDGITLEKMSIDEFLHPENMDTPGYVVLSATTGTYCAVYVPGFSEHTITISTEVLGGIIALSMYIVFAIIIGILLVSPTFISSLYTTYSKRRK
jgi:outer membrane protein assembly factor BamB